MNNEKIDFKEAVAIILMFEIGEFSILTSGFSGQKDTWIAVIAATVCYFPMLWVYLKILKLNGQNEHKDYLDVIVDVFGTKVGKGIILLYAYYCVSLVGYVMLDIANFVFVTNLDKTPKLLIYFIMMALSIAIVRKGMFVIGEMSKIFVFVLCGYLLIVFLKMGVDIDFRNFRPVLYEGIKPLVIGTFEIFIYPFSESIVFFIALLHNFKYKKARKIMVTSMILSSLYTFSMIIMIIGVLGDNYASSLTFTAYGIAKHLKIGFLKRSEVLAAVGFVAGTFVKTSVYLFAATCCIKKVFNLSTHKNVATPLSILALNLVLIEFDGVLDFNEWIFSMWLYYALVFVTIFPILTLVVGKIKKIIQHN